MAKKAYLYLRESRLSPRTRCAALVGGRSPIDCHLRTKNERVLKANHEQKALTPGNLIETVYGVCGNRRARGIIRLAVDAHVVVFREQRHALDSLSRGITP